MNRATLGVIVLLLFVAPSACANGEASSTPHMDVLDGCCALMGCSVVAVSIVDAKPAALGMPLDPVAAPALQSQTRPPILPPPKLASLPAA